MPVLVTGTLDNPHFAPDVQQIAQMKLQNMVPSFGNPGDMTSGIVGAVMGGKKGQGEQQGGVGGILNSITGQQQNQKTQPQQPATGQNQPSNQQAQPANQDNPLGDMLNQVTGGKKKKPQPAPPQNPPPQ
jgi:hypothetical protein